MPTGMSSAKYRPMKCYEEICVFNGGVYNPIEKEHVGEDKACLNTNRNFIGIELDDKYYK